MIHSNQAFHQYSLPLPFLLALFGTFLRSRSCALDEDTRVTANTVPVASRARMPLTWTEFHALEGPDMLPLSGGQADGDVRKSVFMTSRQRGERTGNVQVEARFPGAQVSSAAAEVLPGVHDPWANTPSHEDLMRFPGIQRGDARPLYVQQLDQPQFSSSGNGLNSSARVGIAPTSTQQATQPMQPMPHGLATTPVQTPDCVGPTMQTPLLRQTELQHRQKQQQQQWNDQFRS